MIVWNLVPGRQFERVRHDWDALNRMRGDAALLQARFIALLLRYFGTERVFVARGTQGDTVVAMALVERVSRSAWTTFQPDQAPLGAWQCGTGVDQGAAARALLKHLPGFPLLFGILHQDPDLSPRPADAPALRTLDYIQTARVRTTGGFDDYWATRGKNLRHNLKRQRNRLEREGLLPRLEVVTAAGDMAAVVADYGRLEAAGWKTGTGTAVTPDNRQGAFYRALLTDFAATGDAVAYRLWYGERVVACDLCIRGNAILNWLKTTYDESQTTSSPAGLLRQEAFQLAFADPATRVIEFYGPVMDWHTKWAQETRTLYHINVYRWSWLAALHQRRRRPTPAAVAHSRNDLDQPRLV